MKNLLVTATRIFVGILFLFSGFVKMVDPLGFSYKLEEYFGPGVFNLDFLVPYALPIAITVVILEFLLGIMLLLGYAEKFTRWALLLMIVFFTFLTFYSAYFDKVTDCGCFGDAIPLTPWQSFSKDVILLLLIIFLFVNGKFIQPFLKTQLNKWIIFGVFAACLWLSYHVLAHLPIIDFRPYKVGASIEDGMVSDGAELPPIHDFYIMRDGKDVTNEVLNEDKVMFVCSYDMDISSDEGWEAIKELTDKAIENGYDVIGLSASFGKTVEQLKEKYQLNFDFTGMDETTVKTIIRSNPGVLTLHKGIITQKAHWHDTDDIKVD